MREKIRERIYIIDAKRLPICRSKGDKISPEEGGDGKNYFPGYYAGKSSVELLATVFEDLVSKSKVERKDIADIITGCAIQETDQGANVSRLVQLTTSIPYEVPAASINRLCGSSLTAAMKATEFLIAGRYFKDGKPEVAMVGGIEHMGNHDMGKLFVPGKYFFENFIEKGNVISLNMGLTAEKLAEDYNISRKEQETFAYNSHRKAIKALKEGKFSKETVHITLSNGRTIAMDNGPREYESLEHALNMFSKLRPAFKQGGTVTAATAAPYTDGASGAILATESYVAKHGLEPLAEVYSWASVGLDPNVMGLGPVPATKKALERAGLRFDDIGVIELNEAFAAQSLAVIKQLAKDHKIDENKILEKVNVNGGALALGHPLGATGAKLLATMCHELERRPETEYGLVTMCIGMGQGDAMILKNCK